jgi:hypothetical protein
MSLCPRCGVEIGDVETCPLCGLKASMPLAEGIAKESDAPVDPKPGELSPFERERLLDARNASAWEFTSVTTFIVTLVLTLTAWATDGFSWLWYPLASVIFAWTYATAFLAFRRFKPLMLLTLAVAPPLLLLALDWANGSLQWFLPLGLSLVIDAELAIGLTGGAVALLKNRGLNVFGIVLLGIAAMLMGLEASIDWYTQGIIRFDWANIAGICLVPIAAFVFYVHYRIGKKASLKKLFHL